MKSLDIFKLWDLQSLPERSGSMLSHAKLMEKYQFEIKPEIIAGKHSGFVVFRKGLKHTGGFISKSDAKKYIDSLVSQIEKNKNFNKKFLDVQNVNH